MKNKLWLAVLGVVVVLALVVGGAVLAQTPTPGAGFVDNDGDGVCDLRGTGACAGFGGGMMGRGMAGRGAGSMMGGRWNGATLVDTVAKALNITVADVQAELQQGKTLRQVITAHNSNVDAIVNSFIAARQSALAELVKSGRITQAQADQMLANMRTQVNAHLDQTGLGCGLGGRGTNNNTTPNPVPGGRGGMRTNRNGA